MKIIRDDKWIRLVLENDRYRVQYKSWFRWKDVTFGPYSPYRVGLKEFQSKLIIEIEYEACLKNGKEYVKDGI